MADPKSLHAKLHTAWKYLTAHGDDNISCSTETRLHTLVKSLPSFLSLCMNCSRQIQPAPECRLQALIRSPKGPLGWLMGKPLIKAFWFWQESKQEKEAAWVTWNAEVEAFDKLWWERCLMSPEQRATVGVLMGWLKWPWKQWLSLHLPFLLLAERVYTEYS